MKISLLLLVISLNSATAQVAKIQPDRELTVLGITVGKTTMNEVKEKFKAKEIHHEGDADTMLYALCFYGPGSSTIAFESSEEGGNEKVVKSISINSTQNSYKLKKICQKTSLIKTKLVINGISLGMSPDLVQKLVGTPVKQDTNTIEYKYSIQEKTETGQKNTQSDMTIEFKDSMSNKITVNKTES